MPIRTALVLASSLAAIVLVLALTSLARAGEPSHAAAPQAPARAPVTAAPPSASGLSVGSGEFDEAAAARRVPAPVTARAAGIQQVLDTQEASLAQLRARLGATRDPAARLALQRQAAAIKAEARVAVFRVELDWAVRENPAGDFAALREAVALQGARAEAARAKAAEPVFFPAAQAR